MKKKQTINDIVFVILALASSLCFLFFMIFKQTFIANQFMFFFLSLFFPVIIQFVFKIKISFFVQLVFEIFLILHFVFGEVFNFYVIFTHYDTALHFITAVLLSIFGYSIIHYYLNDNIVFIQILFAFMFSLCCEFMWEILEFSVDHIFDTNMQRFIKNGIILKGHAAIKDTIKDMIVALMGGSTIYFLVKIPLIKNAKITIK
jgi:hypothetical protein